MSTPYGSWKSPITTDLIVSESIRLSQLILDDDDIYWVEMRPSEGGRNVIVRRTPDGQQTDMTPEGFNARTRVHEYGGGAFTVHRGTLFFSNFPDNQLYRQEPGKPPQALMLRPEQRFADITVDAVRQRLICVLEDHSNPEAEACNSLVSIDMNNGDMTVLASGMDFYASPALNGDGSHLAWICWNHPDMPWDNSELWTAAVNADGTLRDPKKIAGGTDESIFQPQWSPDGALYFVSDRTNWWNIYQWNHQTVRHILKREAEFGQPQWVFGMSTYGFDGTGNIVCIFFEDGRWQLARLEPGTATLTAVRTPFTHFENIRVAGNKTVFIAGADIMPNAIVQLDLRESQFQILRKSIDISFDSTFISRPEPIRFATGDGLTAHAYFYPPQNRDFDAPADELPPLIVKTHGGPTGSASSMLDLKIQFWTSRGFAVLDVNYGGSTGYGREYRQRLFDRWGIVDVADCISGAKYLIDQKFVDPDRVVIAGGSAGGYTTLCALTFHDFFRAGASYYGVSDLEALTKDTHKFESRYLDKLIGPYPERRDIYIERSPIHHAEKLSCPVILMQGLEDKIVAPEQSEKLMLALQQKGIPVAYLTFEGEQHGFRKAETIKRSLEGELYFYSKIFRFDLPDKLEPVVIYNFDE